MIVLVLSPFQIQSHLALLDMLPEGSQAHNHIRRVLHDVAGLGGGPAANEQANNRHDTEPTATASPSTSAAPVSTRTRGQRAITSPSTSTARGRGQLLQQAQAQVQPGAMVCLLQQAQAQV